MHVIQLCGDVETTVFGATHVEIVRYHRNGVQSQDRTCPCMACELAIIAYMAGVEQKVSWICDRQKTHGKKAGPIHRRRVELEY
jgi:hypothetical protein